MKSFTVLFMVHLQLEFTRSNFRSCMFHIGHILMCHPPMRALKIPNVIDPIKIKMIIAGMVATAHLTMRMTIDPNGILMSVTTTLP